MSLAKETARNILREAADEKNDDRRKELIKHAVRSESEARLTAMVSLAQSEPRIPVQGKELDSNPWLFNCPNGTVDLRTGELLPHNRKDLITIMSPVNYDPQALCELWLKFLNRVVGGNRELAQYLQRTVGYSLTGDMRAQILFFLYGLGNNGKSTFIATIRKIMAGYGATAPVDMFLAKDKNSRGPKEDLANLQGKRFVAASEVEVGRKLAVVVIKEMTGGEAIRADRKYEHEVEFQPTHKLWISGNHKPVIADTSLAIWRRIKLIPFTVTIPDEEIDEDLPSKLEGELPGILAWAVKGCQAWQREGLKEPWAVTAATLAYRDEEDILAEYLQDCCVLKATATVAKGDLHENYKQWCEKTGCQPVSQKTLRTRLMERGITEGKSGSIRYWRGIGLSEGQEQKEGHLGQEMTIFPENHIREEIHRKVLGKSVCSVPNVPDNTSEAAPVDPWEGMPDYPTEPCSTCGSTDFWPDFRGKRFVCSRCHPQPKK
jgi:putative DNA primase/helicase